MMLEISDAELISSYLDDELDDASRAQFENRLANDNEFANKFAEFTQNDRRLKNAFSKIDNTPVPPAILAMLEDKNNDADNSQSKATQVKEFNYKNWFAMAASILIVVLIVSLENQFNSNKTNNLVSILNNELSGTTLSINANEQVHLTMSFKDKNGNFCREYIMASGADSRHAVSCYIAQQWRQVISGGIQNPVENQYQLASGELSAEVETWLDTNMGSGPISLDEEALLLNR